MSSRIQRLDPSTISRIAAGEVIERPASVLKELIDNALDAGSTRLDIVLRNGGRQLIQVSDNGCGMSADEAVLALQRFTTSKIRHIDDLQTLTTLGFRGEALPSIATVAEVEITTRPAHQSEGTIVRSRREAPPEVMPCGCPVGTRVRVQALFAHVPVRLRGLKSVAREVQIMHELVTHYALGHPHVVFHVEHEGRRLFFAAATGDMQQRVRAVFSPDVASQLLLVSWQSLDLTVTGVVSAPGLHRSKRQSHSICVNGRPVRSPLVNGAIHQAYGALVPPGRHPIVALRLQVSPDGLDVNVHPRKTEITFLHERAIFASVQDAVEQVLQRLPYAQETVLETHGSAVWAGIDVEAPRVQEPWQPYVPTPAAGLASDWQPLGQIGNTFLVARSAQGLILLDQHAAHESLLYAELLAPERPRRDVEAPWTLTLSPGQVALAPAFLPALQTLGFEVEPFGRGLLVVRAVPRALGASFGVGQMLEALQEAIQRAPALAAPDVWQEHLAAALACRTAWRAGDTLSPEQVAMLVEAVAQQRLAYTCPHGRPTSVTLSLAELERRFLR